MLLIWFAICSQPGDSRVPVSSEFVNVYIVHVQPDVVYTNTQMLISGILNLLEQCPPEMVQARRELLNSVKFFYGSDVSFSLC